jgi:hypothetical protein
MKTLFTSGFGMRAMVYRYGGVFHTETVMDT